MGNCLKTQLKEVVNNDNLLRMSELRIAATATASDKKVSIGYRLGEIPVATTTKTSIPCDYYNGANDQLIGSNLTEYTGVISNVDIALPVNTKVVVTVTEKYIVRAISLNNINAVVKGFSHIPLLDQFYATQNTDYDVTGIDLNGFKESDSIRFLQSNALLTGDISNFSDKTSLLVLSFGTYLGNRKTNVTGNVSSLINLVNLNQLGIRDTYITGDMDPVLNAYAGSGRIKDLALSIDVNKIQMTDKKQVSSHTIRFNSGMVNPTEAETARGWQVA